MLLCAISDDRQADTGYMVSRIVEFDRPRRNFCEFKSQRSCMADSFVGYDSYKLRSSFDEKIFFWFYINACALMSNGHNKCSFRRWRNKKKTYTWTKVITKKNRMYVCVCVNGWEKETNRKEKGTNSSTKMIYECTANVNRADPFNLNLWIIILCVHRWITSELLEYPIGIDRTELQDNLFSVRFLPEASYFLLGFVK